MLYYDNNTDMADNRVSVRQNLKERTRLHIIAAAVGMLRESTADLLTMARVAERAGVTERTVYRHFRTRDALIRASWASLQKHMLDSVRVALPALDDHAARRRAAAIQLMRSAPGRSMLHDLGLDGDAARKAALEAVAILLGLQSAH